MSKETDPRQLYFSSDCFADIETKTETKVEYVKKEVEIDIKIEEPCLN